MKKIFAIATSALVLAAPAISAQQGPSEKDIAAYFAINASTVGALPPLATNTLASAGGMGWHFQYGRMDWGSEVSSNAFAGGVDMNLGRGRIGFTAGYMTIDCPEGADCNGHLMVGTKYSTQLTGASFSNGGRWQMGLEGELGVGLPEEERALAISAGIPVKLTFGKNIKVSPFVTPSFAHGSYKYSDDTSESALKFMVGTGVGIAMRNGVGVNFGMRKVFVDEGETQYGLGFTIRPGSTSSRSGSRR
jgi:opacity protein-like surface antigen